MCAEGMNVFAELRGRDYVLWGTGRVARAFYRKYCAERKMLQKPLYYCDNAEDKQGTTIDGIAVRSSEQIFELCRRYYLADQPLVIIVGVTGINLLQIISQLEKQEVKADIRSAVQLDASCYFAEHEQDIDTICASFADEKSRRLYRCLIDNMVHGRPVDFSLVEVNQYFANDVIPTLRDEDVLVDAGVCGGEEIDKALAMNPKIRVHAFEPDGQSCDLLKKKYADRSLECGGAAFVFRKSGDPISFSLGA